MYFDPKTDKFPYPKKTDQHYLVVKKNDGTVFDENYPYIDESKSFKRKMRLTRVLLYMIVFAFSAIRMGLKIKGRENIKKNKKLLKKGAISICNHVHMHDYISIMNAIRPFKPYILSWNKNVSGELGKMVRSVGGIPIPDNNYKASIAFQNHIEKLFNNGGWLHIYPEGRMWVYYAPIRPFKKGCTYFAIKYDKPIVPLAYSYRKPSWIRRVIFRQIACFTLTIGEPMFANPHLPKSEQEMDLLKRCHERVCLLADILPTQNLYGPIFNDSQRIDYYTGEYGKNYKGSH